MAIYSTTAQQGIDVNAVYYLDPVNAQEYPAPPFQPGELAWGNEGSEWVYVMASLTSTLLPGMGALISTSIAPGYNLQQAFGAGIWSVSPIGSAATVPYGQAVGIVGGSVGTQTVLPPSGSQTGAYFWLQRAGNVPNMIFGPQAGATGTINVAVFSTPTASSGGFNTVPGTGSYYISGLTFTNATASVTGPNSGFANYPWVGHNTWGTIA